MQAAGDALAEGLDAEQGGSVTDHEVFRCAAHHTHPPVSPLMPGWRWRPMLCVCAPV